MHPLSGKITRSLFICQAQKRFRPVICSYYFAYGSNMNPARMRARGLSFVDLWAARLPGYGLRFNKAAHNQPGVAYANIVPTSNSCVEGVLYALASEGDIDKMDHFEGTPVRYSRECLEVSGDFGGQSAWVYLANPAFVCEGLLPQSRYLEHLLAGRAYLSSAYLDFLRQQPCQYTEPGCPDRGLLFND